MITYLLMLVLGGVMSLLASVMPDLPSPDSIIGQGDSPWATVLSFTVGSTYWLPFGLIFTLLGVVGVVALAAGGIKLVRIALSFVTLGGGSAA